MSQILCYRPLYSLQLARVTFKCRSGTSFLQLARRNRKCALLFNNIVYRYKSEKKETRLSSLVQALPVTIKTDPDSINIGAELTGNLGKEAVLEVLHQFEVKEEVERVAFENGLDRKLFRQVFVSFRRFCCDSKTLPTDLHVVLSDILQGAGDVTDLLPYFLDHGRHMFPHLDCMEDLCKISDLRLPANWYSDARAIQRKIIYHAGPTNSGKTYHALQKFFTAKSGVYCGPLRMLASEVFQKTNAEVGYSEFYCIFLWGRAMKILLLICHKFFF